MKIDIAAFVVKFPNYQQDIVEHRCLEGFSQNIHIHTWKWEYINMYFIVGLHISQM